MNSDTQKLKLIHLGIDAPNEFVVYIHAGCHICKSEVFDIERQISVSLNGRTIIAILNIIHTDILSKNEASLSENAWKALQAKQGEFIHLSHPEPVISLKYVRSKIHGNTLDQHEFDEIVDDVVKGKYSNAQIASFITACARDNLSLTEITQLTNAMIKSGTQLLWDQPFVMDKHSVGGIPGNRTTPIVVAIVASAGLLIPKTSSRSITSPAGTADTVETMTKVILSADDIRKVVNQENGCMAWGGALGISPADDIIIRVERSLNIDPKGQMIASVLSKKAAVGANHVVIDIPVGPTAKIRSDKTFNLLKKYFIHVGKTLGLTIYVVKTDGIQPLGIGIGPALEAKDILAILKNEKNIANDLKKKALYLSGILLEAGNKSPEGLGYKMAQEILESGQAFKKFIAICEAQGGFTEPKSATFTQDILATRSGIVIEIDNRNLSLIAKLAGAPHDSTAGIEFFSKQGKRIEIGDTLYRIHAQSKGTLEYALAFAKSIPDIIKIGHPHE